MKKIAFILSGSGVYDGTEIHEACAALLALHRAGAEAMICAPSGPQMHVIDHQAGEPAEGALRNIQAEAARIARGPVTALTEVDPKSLDAIVLVGGFGAAKNLCDFAVVGADCTVHPEVADFLRAAHAAGKPIGAMCISPVILTKVFGPDLNPALTLGTDPEMAAAIEAMGGRHIDCPVLETVVDEANNFLSTPAYMLASNIGEVFEGTEVFVNRLMALS